MKCTRFLFLIVALWLDTVRGSLLYDEHQLWRVAPTSQLSLEALVHLGEDFNLDFWQPPHSIGKPVDFRVSPEHISAIQKALTEKGLTDIRVLIKDIQSLINTQRRSSKQKTKTRNVPQAPRTLDTFEYTKYHTADEIYEWMDLVVGEFQGFVAKKQVGLTYQGRPIYVLEIKKPSADGSAKPVIYVDSLIHCREWITTAALMFIFKEMLKNSEFSDMIDNVDWYFIPMINVDGYVETWTGDRLWRKTMSTGPSTVCSGVDANRNWDAFWSGNGASPNPCSYTYHGPVAASESEVRHLQSYILERKEEISALVSVHSYSELILYSYKYDFVLTPEDDLLNSTAKKMSDAIYSKYGRRYVWGPGSSTIYVVSGSTTDWAYEKAGIVLSYSYELRDTGEYGFLLPEDQIIPNGEEFLLGLRALADHVYLTSGSPSRRH